MIKYVSFLFLLLQFCFSGYSKEAYRLSSDTSRLKIVFAGDMMGHMPQISAAYNDTSKTYDYTPVFEYVKTYITSADLAVVNLEVTLAGKPYSGYPQFSSPDQLADNLKKVGFDMLITANNHCVDRGKQGLERTIQVLDSAHIPHTGTFKDSTDKQKNNPLFMVKNNISLAFLNYTYGTNGISVQSPNLVNYIDTANIRRDIDVCKAHHADFIIVTLHWGIEYERYPNAAQRSVATFIRNCGANAIIGSHPHVIQPVERFYHAHDSTDYFPVVFSLGNFVSNQRDRYKDGGLIFELNLEKTTATKTSSCLFLPVWVYRGTIKGKTDYRLIPPFKFEQASSALSIPAADKTKCNEFFADTRLHLNNLKEVKTDQ